MRAGELADNADGRREVGRLARVRYLVVGSVTPLGNLVVDARLVDVTTGLVVQTAQTVAATPEEMLRRLPELARLLMMTDEQKFVYEQQQARRAPVEAVALAPLPPPPELPGANPPPPPAPCPPIPR